MIFSNSAGQIAFGMDGSTSNVVFLLDDEDGQPIFTFKEEGGTSIFDGGDTDVTTHKDFLFDSANAIMFDKSDKALEVNSSLYSINLVDDAKINFGSSQDAQVTHTGSRFEIYNYTGDELRIRTEVNDGDIKLQADDGSGGIATYVHVDGGTGEVDLNHYGSTKLTTLDSGVNITGNLRVNNAEFSAGASAGFAIAMAIAL